MREREETLPRSRSTNQGSHSFDKFRRELCKRWGFKRDIALVFFEEGYRSPDEVDKTLDWIAARHPSVDFEQIKTMEAEEIAGLIQEVS